MLLNCPSMRSLRFLLTVAIVAGLGYSQCTGGLFSIPSVFATTVVAEVEDEPVPMSVESNLCLADVDHAQDDTHAEEQHGECEDGEACLRQSYSSNAERWAGTFAMGGAEVMPPAVLASTHVALGDLGQQYVGSLARTGPLFGNATLHARSLAKRE